MKRLFTIFVIGLLFFAYKVSAQTNDIQRGTVKKVNLERPSVVLTFNGGEREFLLNNNTRFIGVQGQDLTGRLKSIKEGSEVFFKTGTEDGKDVLVGIKPVLATDSATPIPKSDTSSLKPLTELGTGKYHDYDGGLYPGGKNERPAGHEKAGITLAGKVQPLDASGKPSADGKIVLLSVGMSNTAQVSQGFARQIAGYADRNPYVVFVNGAQGGMTAKAIQDPDDGKTGTRYWTVVDEQLKAAGVTSAQVQAVWIKEADAGPTQGFPEYAKTLQTEITRVVQVLPARFPNVRLVYLSSRTFGGYARTPLNPEPYAYESGFSVKWLIEEQIKGEPSLNYDPTKGPVKAPWLSWGPYLWANGAVKRADGFSYQASDFAADGTHESALGQEMVGRELLKFFTTDSTTRTWFIRAK